MLHGCALICLRVNLKFFKTKALLYYIIYDDDIDLIEVVIYDYCRKRSFSFQLLDVITVT